MRERFPIAYALLTLAARAAGAAKELALALVFGTSPFKDAFVAAWAAPALIASYGNETLPALLTPHWARPASASGHAPPADARGLVTALVALQTALAALAFCFPRAVLALVTPGLHGPTLASAVVLERWLAVNIALLGGHNLAAARLNARRRFGWLPAGLSLAALCVLAALAASRGLTLAQRIVWVAAALTAGNALALLLMLVPLAAAGWRSHHAARPTRREKSGEPHPPRALWGSFGALLVAMLVMNCVPLAERMAASGLRSGSLAAWDYAERFIQWIFSLTVAPYTAVAFTRLSELAAVPAALDAFARRFESGLAVLLTLAAPVAVLLAMFATLWTRCVFGWGRFGAASVALTAPPVAWRGAGLLLDAAFYYALFAIYARGGARAKLPIALVLAAVNVPLAFAAAVRWGVAGLAAAHLCGCAGALAWIVFRRARYLPGVHLRLPFAAALRAGGFTLLAAAAVRAALPAAALAGSLPPLASWAWALAAFAATAALALLLARVFAPGLLAEVRHELWPAPALAGPSLAEGATA